MYSLPGAQPAHRLDYVFNHVFCVDFIIKKEPFFFYYFVCNASELARIYILVVRWLCFSRTEGGTHSRHKSSQSTSLQGCGSSASEKVCFWCPLKYSNWEIVGKFIWSCNSSWGLLDTRRVGHLLSSGMDSVNEGESLLFMSLGFHLICHNTTPLIGHFWPSKMLLRSQCIRKCSAIKEVKQECWIVGLKEGISLEKARTEEDAEFHQSDLIGFSQMTSNWADNH